MKLSAILGFLGAALLVAALVMATGTTVSLPGQEEERFRATCSGVVEVDAFGLGSPELDPAPSCVVERCGLLDFRSLSIFGEEGDVALVVNGRVTASQGWDSAVGGNQEFSLTGACTSLPMNVEVQVYERSGSARELADTYSVVLR